MGKKGKRNRQQGELSRQIRERRLVDSFYARLDEIRTEAHLYHKNNLHSKLTKVLEDGIHFMETKQGTIFRLVQVTDDNKISYFYHTLVFVHYYTYKYEKIPGVIDSLLSITQTNELPISLQYYSLIFHWRLALSRQGKTTVDECLSLLNDWTCRVILKGNDGVDAITQGMEATVIVLMLMKEFEKAISIAKQLEQLTGDKMTLAIVYFEQYRLGLSDHSLIHNFMPCPCPPSKYYYYGLDGFDINGRFCQVLLVFAQWEVMYHKQVSREAVFWVDEFVKKICQEHICRSCTQAITDSDVPFVCSGCRVACYCSLDHQRLNWKKDPLTGMRIGHKLLCPMMNVCRKWKQTNDVGNEEAAKKWRRRLDKEILYFLSHGLGLEERCFQKEV
ncbi:predicted protein [Chaetoceros tenuissimus]|uniref:MYND-type domain-containing protein n=1 Tax=Chaetoceros tenuissimus TaxID=426638 RepID=A0AAD3H286_9STRA|nr:predicted protein [Chaetoceros tenuissimus]